METAKSTARKFVPMTDQEVRDTIRQMMRDWNAAEVSRQITVEQIDENLRTIPVMVGA